MFFSLKSERRRPKTYDFSDNKRSSTPPPTTKQFSEDRSGRGDGTRSDLDPQVQSVFVEVLNRQVVETPVSRQT